MHTGAKALALTAALAAILAASACQGERPPLWSMDTVEATRLSVFDGGTSVFVDRSVQTYSLPAFSLRLGGFSGFYYPYPAFGCCPWTGTAFVPGRPRVGWPQPVLPKRPMTAPVLAPPRAPPMPASPRAPLGWQTPPPPGGLGIRPLTLPTPPLTVGR